MASFYIRFGKWNDNVSGSEGLEVPTFLVFHGAEKKLLFAVNVIHNFADEIREEKFKQALLCYAIQRIEQGLQGNIFPSQRSPESQRISIREAERPFLERLLQEKICSYQLQEGRDLFCSAADINDPGKVVQIGFRTVAPTSRATCRVCALPNTDYVCSHLVHPLVRSCPAHDTSLLERLLVGANCNLGRDEIRGGTAPSFCRAGGHQCWERIVEPKSASSEIITGSRENAAVYLSYAWGDSYETGLSREDIVDRLYDALLADGYPVRRDKMDLGYKGLISAFMQEIGRGDCIVVIISDKYLKSPFCMFELLEIYRHQEFHDRVFPIVLADARLRTLADRLTYVAHWKAEPDHIKHLIEQVGIDVISASGSFQEYEKYREITHNADKLLTYLADINSQTPQMLAANDFETLRRAIDARLRQVAQRVSTKM